MYPPGPSECLFTCDWPTFAQMTKEDTGFQRKGLLVSITCLDHPKKTELNQGKVKRSSFLQENTSLRAPQSLTPVVKLWVISK